MRLLLWLGGGVVLVVVIGLAVIISVLQVDLDELEEIDPLEEDWLHG